MASVTRHAYSVRKDRMDTAAFIRKLDKEIIIWKFVMIPIISIAVMMSAVILILSIAFGYMSASESRAVEELSSAEKCGKGRHVEEVAESDDMTYVATSAAVAADHAAAGLFRGPAEAFEILESAPVEDKLIYEYTDEEYELFCKVVEAEVTGETWTYNGQYVDEDEMLLAKIRVAQVFLNRVFDTERFGKITTVYDAITEKNASSTFNTGRVWKVEVTDLTREAVRLAALESTPDYSGGGLFFKSGSTECDYGDLILVDSVGHAFFK